jgi:UDPglucose 6-dehydrogenase
MNLSVVGTGYVGLVAGTCFAERGNHVICVDVDEAKIETLKRGELPIYEPGLGEILRRNLEAGRLVFTTDLAEAVANSLIVFIAVGTPEAEDGSADLAAVMSVAEQISRHMDGYRIVVTKSTVPVGTHRRIAAVIKAGTHHPFDVVSNPEFMKEGAALEDFTRPDRVILGTENPAVVEILRQLYAPFMRKRERIIAMDPASAEMTKYAANALLATRVSFMNEVANLCERYGADVETVRQGIGADARIGHAFLFSGVGYGGSCFPKDVSAFIHMGKGVGYSTDITLAAQEINRRQRQLFADRIIDRFGDRAASTTLAVWGLAFKGRTDDVREAPAIDAVRAFVERGMKIRCHDPEAMDNARQALRIDGVAYFTDGYEALGQADALVIFTDWPEFRTPDFEGILRRLRSPVIFDGRNLYDPAFMARLGFEYHSVGRPTLPAEPSRRVGVG